VKKNKDIKSTDYKAWLASAACISVLAFISQDAAADGSNTLGTMATSLTSTFAAVGNLITGGSYIAGLGFSIGAIMKFKQHKDNPTQIPIGTPIALVFIAAALLFLPTILSVTGNTMFGSSGGTTAGPTGTTIT
jgi:intracellular multiplication protein IcmD